MSTIDTYDNASSRKPAPVAAGETTRRTALVVTNDHRSKQLAPVWLGEAGFDVTIAETAQDALRIVSECSISVTLADAAINVDDNKTLIRELESMYGTRIPVMGLCADKAEVDLAHISRAADAFEGPHDWQAISRCCVKMLSENEILERLESAYSKLTARETNHPTST